MFLNFRRKKLLILRDNEIGPGTDFSQEKIAFAFIQNVFEFPGKKFLSFRRKGFLSFQRKQFSNPQTRGQSADNNNSSSKSSSGSSGSNSSGGFSTRLAFYPFQSHKIKQRGTPRATRTHKNTTNKK